MYVKSPRELQQARKDMKITQVELARLCQVSQQYISLMETGVDRDCSEEVATRIAKYLEVKRGELFDTRVVVRTAPVTTASCACGQTA